MDFYFSLIKVIFHRFIESVESGLPYPSPFDVKASSLQALENTSDECKSRCVCCACNLCKVWLTWHVGEISGTLMKGSMVRHDCINMQTFHFWKPPVHFLWMSDLLLSCSVVQVPP